MGAGRRRGWWLRAQHWEEEASKEAKQEEEEKDGRLKSEGSERRVPSEGHATPSDRTKI